MWPAVAEVFYPWNARYEGVLFSMYADILGLVTTGVGNLIDPVSLALPLPWQHPDGSAASEGEIREAWQTVKNDPDAARLGAGYAAKLTDLRLTEQAVADLVAHRLEQNAAVLTQRFPDFGIWPADAQLAVLSMAWAMGPGFSFPKFEAAVKEMDFAAAADQATIREEGNPGVVPRNKADRALLLAAAASMAAGADPAVLTEDYSGLKRPGGGGPPDAGGAPLGRVPWGAIFKGAGVGLVVLAVAMPGAILGPLALLGAAIKRRIK